MSGAFTKGFYVTDEGEVHSCRLQPETLTSWNSNGAGPTTSDISAYAKGSRRRNGLHCRRVTLSRQVGSGEDYDSATVTVTVPIMTNSAYNALSVGDTLAYQGKNDWLVAAKTDELLR